MSPRTSRVTYTEGLDYYFSRFLTTAVRTDLLFISFLIPLIDAQHQVADVNSASEVFLFVFPAARSPVTKVSTRSYRVRIPQTTPREVIQRQENVGKRAHPIILCGTGTRELQQLH